MEDMLNIVKLIKRSFTSVFSELELKTEVWFQRSKILTISRDLYADWIVHHIGSYPLFGTNHIAHIDDSFVRVDVSPNIGHESYDSKVKIRKELLAHREDAIQRPRTGITLSEAINNTNIDIALIGIAGSGKTTLLKYLTLQAARGEVFRGLDRFPIYIAVRDIQASNPTIKGAAIEYLNFFQINESERVFASLIKTGNVIFLIDGLDETNEENQALLVREIDRLQKTSLNLIKRYEEQRREQKDRNELRPVQPIFIVTGRPYSLNKSLNNFKKYEVLPLSVEGRTIFASKWFEQVNPAKGVRFNNVIMRDPELISLGATPLILSILCALYNNELNVPKEKEEMLQRCVEGLMGGWDHFRNIVRGTVLKDLTLVQRVLLVSSVAMSTMSEDKITFNEQDLAQSKLLKSTYKRIKTAAIDAPILLQCLYNDFGIITERAAGIYTFVHLLFHEYMSAKFIIDNRIECHFLDEAKSDIGRWREVLIIIARLLPNSDEYLTKLCSLLDLQNTNHVSLLKQIWSLRPNVDNELEENIAVMIADAISANITTSRMAFNIGHKVVTVKYYGYRLEDASIARIKTIMDLIDTLKNLPRNKLITRNCFVGQLLEAKSGLDVKFMAEGLGGFPSYVFFDES